MSLPEMQARMKARIWQVVAQSGVDVSSVPQPEMDKLVGGITDGVLQEMDDILGQVGGNRPPESSSQQGDDDEPEVILWEGRPFLSLSIHYKITNERVRVETGIFAKERYDVELVKIQDIDHKQNLTERAFNIGDVFIQSHDPTHPELILNNVSDPTEVNEILRNAMLKERKKHKLSYREEM